MISALFRVIAVSLLLAAVPGRSPGEEPSLLRPAFAAGQTFKATITTTTNPGSSGQQTSQISATISISSITNELANIAMNASGTSAALQVRLRDDHVFVGSNDLSSSQVTSGIVFDPAWAGMPPGDLHVGQHWTGKTLPGNYNPAGISTITVTKIDLKAHTISLKIDGAGSGPNLNEMQHGSATDVTINAGGHTTHVTALPGKTTWKGTASYANGILTQLDLRFVSDLDVPKTEISMPHTVSTVTALSMNVNRSS